MFQKRKTEKRKTITEYIIDESIKIAESVGSWWLTVIFLIIIGWLVGLQQQNILIQFYVPLTYTIFLSMFYCAPINGLLAGYLSDQIFVDNYRPVLANLSGALLFSLPIIFILTFLLCVFFSHKSIGFAVIFAAMTVSLSAVWITNNVMAILKLGRVAFITFSLGVIFSFLLNLITMRVFGLEGIFIALMLGFGAIAFIQYGYVVKGFYRGKVTISFTFLGRNPGALSKMSFFIFFNLALWIDKIVYWFMPQTSYQLDPLFRYSDYDYPFFVAFTIFSFSQFLTMRRLQELIKVPYAQFTDALFYNFPFSRLDEGKYNLILGYRKIFYSLVLVYGAIILMILFSISVGMIRLPWQNEYSFYLLLMSTLFLGIFLLNLLILQYMNQYKLLTWLCIWFFIFSGGFSILIIQLELPYDGLAFFIASMMSFIISSYYIDNLLGHWENVVIKGISENF